MMRIRDNRAAENRETAAPSLSVGPRLLLSSLGTVFAVETFIALLPAGSSTLPATGLARLLETILLLLLNEKFQGPAAVKLLRRQFRPGVRRGLWWSAGFGLLSALAGGVLVLAGFHPAASFPPPPPNGRELILLYLVGGLAAPPAEEILFRGIIYGYLRRLGIPPAIVVSSLVFGVAHLLSGGGLQFQHLAGGAVFALAYEAEKNLWVPITIHVLGNLALFTAALLIT